VLKKLSGRDDVLIELEMKSSAATKNGRLDEYCRKLYETAKRVMKPGTYAFTSFDEDYLKAMKRVDPASPTGLISGKPMSKELIDRALELGCVRVAPVMNGSTRELVDLARSKGLQVTLWMVQNLADYEKAKALGADAVTSDYPILLRQRVRGHEKKLIALDLDATLCQHRSAIPPENLAALKKLQERYRCIMVGAGNAPRIYRQMGNHPIEIVGNYGMQEADGLSGELKLVRAVTNQVDKGFFLEKTDYLRKKYGYTEYAGDSVEFHPSGMVTFGLLGTKALKEDKVKFDPDRAKRRAMYREVCEIFKDYSVYIGGSTSFDFAGKSYNKYDATLDWAKRHGYTLDDIVFIGDDFADGGGDSHVRTKDKTKVGGYPRMDYIVINDYRKFPQAVQVLLK
jgi:hydroxymethylpyrimidine pyrophosphatase-like HAD family hydrolase